ncbi:MAG: D-alanyl-D-alanine carboxypeptidase/D-alanyl-D-alanine-endopeptidase [Balneolaceae bacterium]
MNRFFKSPLLFFPLFWVLTPAVSAQMPAAEGAVRSLIDESPAASALWSVVVSDEDGRILIDIDGDRIIRPASMFKLISSAAALNILGPDFRYRTRLYGTGELDGDVWRGDLLIRGVGDPAISGEFTDGNALFLFETWADLLLDMGVRSIDGNILGNDSYFDDLPYPRGWEWDDLSYYYAAEISALSFNNNVVDLEVVADGEVGDLPEISWFPFQTSYVRFVNEQVITPPFTDFDESYHRIPGSNTIFLRSRLPQGYLETEPLSVPEPAIYFVDTFRRHLEMEGVDVLGEPARDRTERNWSNSRYQLLHEHISVPLREMIRWKIRESDNFYAEMILKTVAAEDLAVPGSTELGLDVLRNFMAEAGFDTTQVTLRDASGMAPATLLNMSDLNRFFHRVREYDWVDVFDESLAIAGREGTLSHRFHQSPIFDRFRGKTGFTSGVRTIGGYLETSSGRQLIVTIATNNFTSKVAVIDRIHQQILENLFESY